MQKTILEKRIEEKAEAIFEQNVKEFVDFCQKNPIAKRLKVLVLAKGAEDDQAFIPLVNWGSNWALVNGIGIQNKDSVEYTNIENIYEELITEYQKQETDNVLNKLENIKYLFESNQ